MVVNLEATSLYGFTDGRSLEAVYHFGDSLLELICLVGDLVITTGLVGDRLNFL